MCCSVAGLAVEVAKLAWIRTSSSFSAWRMPNENELALSFRYQLYPRLWALSRAQKKLCGGGNAAIDPALPSSAMTRRFLVFSGDSRSLFAPPNQYDCGLFAGSRHATRVPEPIDSPLRPPSYLYATGYSAVLAMTSCRIRFVPLYTVN